MSLTRDFKDTVKARAERDPVFRVGLLRESVKAMISDDIETGKVLLRHYMNATTGFESLVEDVEKNPQNLIRMLSSKENINIIA